MPHNCPPDWVYVNLFGCFQSMDHFYSSLVEGAAITALLAGAATAVGLYRRPENKLKEDSE